jgi:hypothetical protein
MRWSCPGRRVFTDQLKAGDVVPSSTLMRWGKPSHHSRADWRNAGVVGLHKWEVQGNGIDWLVLCSGIESKRNVYDMGTGHDMSLAHQHAYTDWQTIRA